MESSITEAELLDALNVALGDVETEDGYTSEELAEITGWGRQKILDNMKKLIVAGTWERLHVTRTSVVSGVTRGGVNAYRPVVSGD